MEQNNTNTNQTEPEQHIKNNLIKVFGEIKAEKIIKKIKTVKQKNPHQRFSFVFDENGEFKAIPKK